MTDLNIVNCEKLGLIDPDSGQSLRYNGKVFVTEDGKKQFPIVDGIPVILGNRFESNFWVLDDAKKKAEGAIPLMTMPSISEAVQSGKILEMVREIQGATSGRLYRHLTDGMAEYPIPEIRLPEGNGKLFLDVGCNWGRWLVAAARKGYKVVGIDVHLEGLRAARRVLAQLNVDATLICADARQFPFKNCLFDQIFSYSVLQHFSRENFSRSLCDISRVTNAKGNFFLQMPNRIGIRNLQNRIKNNFREEEFDVRYYFPSELLSFSRKYFSRAEISIDGFFGLGIQPSNIEYFTSYGKMVCFTSERLREICKFIPKSYWIADSLYMSMSGPSVN